MTTASDGTERTQATTTERLKDQARTVGEDLRTLGGIAREAAGEKLDDARRAVRGAYDEGRRRTGTEIDRLAAHIREKPLQSVAIAAGLGALLGLLLRRRD